MRSSGQNKYNSDFPLYIFGFHLCLQKVIATEIDNLKVILCIQTLVSRRPIPVVIHDSFHAQPWFQCSQINSIPMSSISTGFEAGIELALVGGR